MCLLMWPMTSAVDMRQKMAADYIGYDKPEDAEGHKRREDLLRFTGSWMERKQDSHSKAYRS